jgi:ribonuclease P protein component
VTYLLAGNSGHPARAGLVVGKSVGNSVVRHRVSRRLREQLRGELSLLAEGDRVVVRALPGAADRSSAALGEDLRASLRRLTSPAREQS